MVTFVLSFDYHGIKVKAFNMLPYRKPHVFHGNIIKPSFLELAFYSRYVLGSITFFLSLTVIWGAWIYWKSPLPRRQLTYFHFCSSSVPLFFALDRWLAGGILRKIHVFLWGQWYDSSSYPCWSMQGFCFFFNAFFLRCRFANIRAIR